MQPSAWRYQRLSPAFWLRKRQPIYYCPLEQNYRHHIRLHNSVCHIASHLLAWMASAKALTCRKSAFGWSKTDFGFWSPLVTLSGMSTYLICLNNLFLFVGVEPLNSFVYTSAIWACLTLVGRQTATEKLNSLNVVMAKMPLVSRGMLWYSVIHPLRNDDTLSSTGVSQGQWFWCRFDRHCWSHAR